ncbi:hypothetical protein RSOLAG1IB_04818 [Rhizoctonia solani AG-1 IB]|uniref:Uncharacterized protein n=1 Tax=Thanatephorus cucumeris (strain AG1-IB / isolate 7/3/14) TaxID=1108050 RepID=A0A0B7G1W8_THACB|nr:hypothetical protein RSOLAG1IB_04818 [Rhizoctonia solani AG-1 IB]
MLFIHCALVRATKACAKNNTPCVFPRVPPVRNLTRFRTTHTHGPSTPLSYVLLPHTTWFSRPLPGSFGAAALVAPQFGLPPSTPCHCPRAPDPGHISVGFKSLSPTDAFEHGTWDSCRRSGFLAD